MIYKGSNKIEDVYIGNTKIEFIYKGSTQVYSSKLPAGQVIFESSTAGTYTIVIPKTQTYHIDLVGGGGGGHKSSSGIVHRYGGGSGGYVYGLIFIPAGTYTLLIGSGGGTDVSGGNSSFFNQIAGGGVSFNSYAGGTCTTTLNYINGNNGGKDYVGESVYGGYGRGGYSIEYGGTGGYCKIVAA